MVYREGESNSKRGGEEEIGELGARVKEEI
jgi:hypothetical protein